jgi:hypothetical protein
MESNDIILESIKFTGDAGMKNLMLTNEAVAGNVYMVEMNGEEPKSFRMISETPTHFILSFTKNDFVEVFEKSKADIKGIYNIKEWLNTVEG